MEIIVCSAKHDKEIFDYLRQKRPNYGTAEFRKIYVHADDRNGRVEVIDNRTGEPQLHTFEFGEYMMYHEQLVMEAAKTLYPEGESK